jgi:hypothetical protein
VGGRRCAELMLRAMEADVETATPKAMTYALNAQDSDSGENPSSAGMSGGRLLRRFHTHRRWDSLRAVRVISLLRSTVAGSRQRPIGALAILTVIVGVVTMHSMSGSPALHMHHAPHEASVASAELPASEPAGAEQLASHQSAPLGATAAQVSAVVDVSAAQTPEGYTFGEPGPGVCHDGCGGHDLATAMCLMILVAILALFVPARRLLWRTPLEWSITLVPATADAGALGAPSLHELCISRT